MKYVDIHTHTKNSTKDVIVVQNLSLSDAEKIIASDSQGFYSVGIHPWDLENVEKDWVVRLEELCKNNKIVLIGECGLDKNTEASLERQSKIFIEHIQLSELVKKPLIIHCVGYFNELITLKKEHNPTQKWIIHGFRGKPQLAEQLLKGGFDLSYGEKFNPESVRVTPVERLFVETDESAVPIEMIYEQIAEIKDCKVEDLIAGRTLLSEMNS